MLDLFKAGPSGRGNYSNDVLAQAQQDLDDAPCIGDMSCLDCSMVYNPNADLECSCNAFELYDQGWA